MNRRQRPTPRHSQRRRAAGFTLNELMLVVMILGILAVIAYASYASQIKKAQRSVAKSVLLDTAARQERYFFTYRVYTTDMSSSGTPPGLGHPTSPAYFGKDGIALGEPEGAIYKLSGVTTDCGAQPCFKLTATPIGAQAGDSCGDFTITNTGVRDAAQANCW